MRRCRVYIVNAAAIPPESHVAMLAVLQLRHKGSVHQQRVNHWLDLLAEGEPLNLEFLHSLQLGRTTAGAVMTSPVLTRDEQTDLAEIADVLLKHSIKRVPITRNGKLVGIVSRRDILRALIGREEGPP